ncbi:MAG: hypothetical protein MR991_07510 [Clostridiales bacterium]|nr:hypothetical protein [Clostridiales bacterium]MDD7035705.1 hypothetical protein [Bacillota bacterium]MDY2920647.1 hypothetical protein [Lentihominibacter sp.]
MTNIFFPDEKVTRDDVYFICYMIERVARKLKQRNSYVVNSIGVNELVRLLCLANVLHSQNPIQVEDEWINEYKLTEGTFDITDVDEELVDVIPTETQMGKVYMRLIFATLLPDENYAEAILRVYNDSICDILDNYNSSAYYEPSYVIARAYNQGGF